MGLIGKIFGKRSPATDAPDTVPGRVPTIADIVGADLGLICRQDDALLHRAVDYVLDGGPDSVLADIHVKGFSSHNAELVRQRQDLFLSSAGTASGVVARYCLVLIAAETPRYQPLDLAPKARFAVARALADVARVFWDSARTEPVTVPRDGLTLDNAVEIARALGGDRQDVIAAVLMANRHSYNNVGSLTGASSPQKSVPFVDQLELEPIFRLQPELVIKAAEPLGEPQWQGLRLLLVHWQLLGKPEYLTFFMNRSAPKRKTRNTPRGDDAATSVLKSAPQEVVERLMIEALPKADMKLRAHLANWLAGTGTASALNALETHLSQEKAGEVRRVIETALAGKTMAGGANEQDDETGYWALGGVRVEIPPLKPFETGETPVFGASDRAELRTLVGQENQRWLKRHEEEKQVRPKASPPRLANPASVDGFIDFLNGQDPDGDQWRANEKHWRRDFDFCRMLDSGVAMAWWLERLRRFPEKERLVFCRAVGQDGFLNLQRALAGRNCSATLLKEYLASPRADLRQVERLVIEKPEFYRGEARKAIKGDVLAELIGDGYWRSVDPDDIAHELTWPLVASNLHVIDEAFAASAGAWKLSRPAAFRWLSVLPKTPRRLVAPLLAIATGAKKENRADARRLLADLPGLDEHLISMLGDKRQETRAEASAWLAERRSAAAEAALRKQLKTEKSDGPRATMLTALRRIGADISEYAGPAALLAEARQGLRTAKLDKLGWLPVAGLGAFSYRNGDQVPGEVITWWLHLACKLKQPGGNGLLALYLDQLAGKDAEALSMKVFDSWIEYDTESRVEERWLNPQVLLDRRVVYQNNGAEVKGVLALARAVPPVHAVKRVRWYLKNHGHRSHQGAALLELLASKGDPVSLQLVLSSAQRLKQKSVQKLAQDLVARIAEDNDWSIDALADRTVPTGGLDEDGKLELVVGDDGKVYVARLDEALKLVLFNPASKMVKALPSGDDEATKEAKKAFSAAKKEIDQAVQMQSDRLYEAMCSGRTWSTEDWLRDFRNHPLMRKLGERLVWLALNEKDDVAGIFRPTPEGDCIDLDDNGIDIAGFSRIRLAHAALIGPDVARKWQAHLKDFEVASPFAQFGREFIALPEDLKQANEIADRLGWVTTTFTVRGLAKKQGYERGEVVDSGHFDHYLRRFPNSKLIGVIGFSGNCLPEEELPAVIHKLHFAKDRNGRPGPQVRLKDVPSVLLSECWHDYHAIAAKGAFDPEWEKRSPW